MTDQTKTILFCPLNSPGHINSSLGIADKLKENYGFRTVFLILGPTISNTIEKHGHELITLDEVDPYIDYDCDYDENGVVIDKSAPKRIFGGAEKWPKIITRFEHLFALDPIDALISLLKEGEYLMLDEVIDNHDNYAAAIKQIAPDLVVVDAYYVPPCIVKLTDVPWVRLYSANPIALVRSKLAGEVKPPSSCGFSLLSKAERLDMRLNKPDDWNRMLESWQAATNRVVEVMDETLARFNKFLVENGCSRLPLGQQAHDSPHLNLYMYPSALDYDQEDDIFEYPARWMRCDSLIRKTIQPDSAEAIKWNRMIDEKMDAAGGKIELVFFSLGSLASGNVKSMSRFVDILRDDKKRLYVFSKGANGDRYNLDPSNMIGEDYVPQNLLLERANLAIIHGGNNSVAECLYFGVPMIILPVFADQIDNAQRLVDLKLGKRLDVRKCTKQELQEAIESTLADSSLVAKIKEIGRQMRLTDDSRRVSSILKKLIEDKKIDQEYIEQMRI